MHLVIQFPGDGMVPRERLGPIPQLFMRTTAEQCAEQLVAHGQVMENLEHVNEDRDGHGE